MTHPGPPRQPPTGAGPPQPDFTVKPALGGDKVVLRPYQPDDIPALLTALRDPEVLRLTGSVHEPGAGLGPGDEAEARKAGFVAEGVLRESFRYGDQWIDATIMSILESEWARHRGRPAAGRPVPGS